MNIYTHMYGLYIYIHLNISPWRKEYSEIKVLLHQHFLKPDNSCPLWVATLSSPFFSWKLGDFEPHREFLGTAYDFWSEFLGVYNSKSTCI